MINADEYGFLPENNAYENSEALQKAFDRGGAIEIIAALPSRAMFCTSCI